MTVRISATLVALALVLALDAGTFMLAGTLVFAPVPIALLPLWAAAGGFVAGRWGAWPAPVPSVALTSFHGTTVWTTSFSAGSSSKGPR